MMHTGGLFHKYMINKFLDINEQINLLKSRGLKITNAAAFDDFLLKNNYYRIKGYSLTLRNGDEFHSNVSEESIYDIYNADIEMRNIILLATQFIEINAKSYFAYEFAKHFDSASSGGRTDFYNDASNYTFIKKNKKKTFSNRIDKISKRIKDQTPNELPLQHYATKYSSILPLWVYVEYMTMSDVSVLFNFLPETVKERIAQNFGVKKPRILSNHLRCVSNLRNLCAHNYRLYNRHFITKPSLSKAQKDMIVGGNGSLFSYLLIIKQLMNNNDNYKLIFERLKNLTNKYTKIDIKCYGFPDNWEECLK